MRTFEDISEGVIRTFEGRLRTFEDIVEGVIRTFEGRLRTFDALMLGLLDDKFEDAYDKEIYS